MLSTTRDGDAAEPCFRKVLDASHATLPRVMTVDKNPAYPLAFEALHQARMLPEICQLRQCQFLNNLVEQDHRCIKRRVNPGWGFGGFAPAQRTIQGDAVRHMFRKGQIEAPATENALAQAHVINQLCEVAA
jgi:transposase, IS6 family